MQSAALDVILQNANTFYQDRTELSETVFRPNESITTTRTGRVVKPVRRLLESMSMVIGESGSKEPLAALFKVLSTFVEV